MDFTAAGERDFGDSAAIAFGRQSTSPQRAQRCAEDRRKIKTKSKIIHRKGRDGRKGKTEKDFFRNVKRLFSFSFASIASFAVNACLLVFGLIFLRYSLPVWRGLLTAERSS